LAQPAGAPETPPEESPPRPAEAEATRWQRDPVIGKMKQFYPPDGIRPKGVSIAGLRTRINNEPEFKGRPVSEDTVRLADIEIRTARKKLP
jgi:hypothetical protein